MTFREHKIDEALRRHLEFERRFGKSQLEFLLNAQSYEQKLAFETNKLIQDIIKPIEQQAFAALESISIPAREAVGKNLAEFHAFAASSIAQTEIDALKTSAIANKHYSWRLTGSWATSRVAAYIAAFALKFPKDTLDRAAQAVAEATKFDISKLGAIGGSSALAALDFSGYDKDVESIRALHNSYSGQLAAALRECLSSEEISEETIKPIEELLKSKIDSLPQGRISAEGLVAILLTLISVLIAHGAFGTIDQLTTTEETGSQVPQLSPVTSL